MTQPLQLKAYAKVNLGLDVLRRREDGCLLYTSTEFMRLCKKTDTDSRGT